MTLTDITLAEIFDAIEQIDDLNELDGLRDALNERYSKVRAAQFGPGERPIEDAQRGDTVEFIEGISPKYMIGLTATVESTNRKSVVVTCPDEPKYGRFRGKSKVRCPNSIVKLV